MKRAVLGILSCFCAIAPIFIVSRPCAGALAGASAVPCYHEVYRQRLELLDLFESRGAAAAEELAAGLEGSGAYLARTAAHLLARAGPQARDALIAGMEHPDSRVREILARGLVKAGLVADFWEEKLAGRLPWDDDFFEKHRDYLPLVTEALPPSAGLVARREMARLFDGLPPEKANRYHGLRARISGRTLTRPFQNPLRWQGEPAWLEGYQPLAYWRFALAGSSRVEDLSGNGNHLVGRGSQAVSNGALLFRETDALALRMEEFPGESFTIDAWFYFPVAPGRQDVLRYASSRANMVIQKRPFLGLDISQSGIDFFRIFHDRMGEEKWQRVTVVWQEPEISVYVDNQRRTRRFEGDFASGGELTIGGGLVGMVDTVVFYPFALSDSEIMFNVDFRDRLSPSGL